MGFLRKALSFVALGPVGYQMAEQYEAQRKAERQQSQALAAQRAAQDASISATMSEQRRAAQAQRAADAKGPDIAALLGSEQKAAQGGYQSTLLTGPGGVDRKKLKLGRPTLLGDPGSV